MPWSLSITYWQVLRICEQFAAEFELLFPASNKYSKPPALWIFAKRSCIGAGRPESFPR